MFIFVCFISLAKKIIEREIVDQSSLFSKKSLSNKILSQCYTDSLIMINKKTAPL